MRVVHIIDLLIWGGAQKLLVYFAQEAKKHDVEMEVIALRPIWSQSPFPAQLESLGIPVTTLNIKKLYDPRAIPSLVKILRRGKFDVIQTHLTHSNVLGVIAGRLIGIPVFATLHTTNESDLIGHFVVRRQIQRFILKKIATRVIAVAISVADAHRERLGGRKIDVIPNAVVDIPIPSSDQRIKLRSELMNDPDRLLILSVGRLIEDKGFSDMIDAFSIVSRKYNSAYLLIVGAGELLTVLTEQVQKLGLENFVGLIGAHDDAALLMSVADIYVSSSHREGLSIALLEAMAAGLPILATSVGETRSLLAAGRGVLVPPKDIEKFTGELSNLIDQPALRTELGNSAREYVKAHYTLSVWMESLVNLYSEELNK
jgi:glycosyltransferase involved in cell wall biosynthesis